jgi:hypothetical protein
MPTGCFFVQTAYLARGCNGNFWNTVAFQIFPPSQGFGGKPKPPSMRVVVDSQCSASVLFFDMSPIQAPTERSAPRKPHELAGIPLDKSHRLKRLTARLSMPQMAQYQTVARNSFPGYMRKNLELVFNLERREANHVQNTAY